MEGTALPVQGTSARSDAAARALVLEPAAYDDPVSQRLVAALQQEFVERYGGPDETPVRPEEFAPPLGTFLVGRLDGEPVACGGWRRVDAELGEIKRMYVAREHRRRGLSRVVLAALEGSARAAGLRRLRLESGDRQPEAVALYTSSGWTPIPPFGLYASEEGNVCLGKEL